MFDSGPGATMLARLYGMKKGGISVSFKKRLWRES
jgi:hypothetical protein